LFRSTSDAEQRRELIMLIRPTVLPTPQDASTFAAEERGKMPVTRAAEDDYNKYEKKLLDEENRRQERNNRKLYKKESFSKEQ
jgi:type II secretory pathway component GspD/PulD (secretin)